MAKMNKFSNKKKTSKHIITINCKQIFGGKMLVFDSKENQTNYIESNADKLKNQNWSIGLYTFETFINNSWIEQTLPCIKIFNNKFYKYIDSQDISEFISKIIAVFLTAAFFGIIGMFVYNKLFS